MKRHHELKVIESESDESIPLEAIPEIEELLADLLFQAWLKEKTHPPSGDSPSPIR